MMKGRCIHAVSVTDASGAAIQHLEYMAFGEVFVDQRRTGFGTPYKFNAKELDCESGYYYYGARYYDPRMARFLSVDPLASDMPAWGSYTYTFDNPIRLVDPTGMRPEDIIIGYLNEDGNYDTFHFNGSNAGSAPDNKFVQDFLSAYSHNTKNGGGLAMKELAENSSLKVRLEETSSGSQFSRYQHEGEMQSFIHWNPYEGIETENGDVLSPATILEHESDHALDRLTNPNHSRNRSPLTNGYTNTEEFRVISGNETLTARMNGEIGFPKLQSRFCHSCSEINSVRVKSPISTKPAILNYFK